MIKSTYDVPKCVTRGGPAEASVVTLDCDQEELVTTDTLYGDVEKAMAKSEQQRQKQLAKKRAKEQRKLRELSRQKQLLASKAGQMQAAAKFPIYACFAPTTIGRAQSDENSNGMGTLVIARQLPKGVIAFVAFLIDAWCLGVKDVAIGQVSKSEFEEFLEKVQGNEPLGPIDPSCARKLTEEAVEYARSLGFPPAEDYAKAAHIWGDVDSSECVTEFVFGHQGKPYYFAGPHDNMAKQNHICSTLRHTVGEGNFHFTCALPSSVDSLTWADDEEVRSIDG